MFAKIAFLSYDVHSLYVTFSRFVIGSLAIVPIILRDRSVIYMNKPLWVLTRAFTNVTAVFLFFFAIRYTTVSKANLLNMTYPLFVFLFAPLVTGERNSLFRYAMLFVTLVGVWNVVRPEHLEGLGSIVRGDGLAFASALTAGFSIATLRRARLGDDSFTIVFYVMVLGLVINLGLLPFVPRPAGAGLGVAILAGAFGAIGQFLLTFGFRHVSAAGGSILSTARIPIAAVLGVLLFDDPFTLRTLLGAGLIVLSLIATALVRDDSRTEGQGAASSSTDGS